MREWLFWIACYFTVTSTLSSLGFGIGLALVVVGILWIVGRVEDANTPLVLAGSSDIDVCLVVTEKPPSSG